MVWMVHQEIIDRVLEQVQKDSPRPIELLTVLESQMSYRDVQDAISELLDSDKVILDSDRKLHINSQAV